MADQQTAGYSESDVESLGKKLEQFSKSLTPGEHAALVEVLKRAQPQEGDVEGFWAKGHGSTTAHVPGLIRNSIRGGLR